MTCEHPPQENEPAPFPRTHVRDAINRHKGLSLLVTLMVAAGAAYGAFYFSHRDDVPIEKPMGWYTSDDGKTFAAAPLEKASPIDRDGKRLYRCVVFECGSGKRFAGYLLRITPAGSAAGPTTRPGVEIKAPGGAEEAWVPEISEAGAALKQVQCPDGTPARAIAP